MKKNIFLYYENGLPTTTAQEKGLCIQYRVSNGQRVPYIQHYKKEKVKVMRRELELRLKKDRPAEPIKGPVRLQIFLYFSVKDKKLWNTYKTKRPDCSNFVKEIEDAMTSLRYWEDDSQIADLRIVKYYSERAAIVIQLEELEP